MFDQNIFLKKIFGNDDARIISEVLDVLGGSNCRVLNPAEAKTEAEGLQYTLNFNGGISLTRKKTRRSEEIVISSEGAIFKMNPTDKGKYITMVMETSSKEILNLELTLKGKGSLEYYNKETCDLGGLTYKDDLLTAKEHGFLPDKVFDLSKKHGNYTTEEIIYSLKETGNIFNRLEVEGARKQA